MENKFIEEAIQLVMIDLLEGGLLPVQVQAYMKTESFEKQVARYAKMFQEEFTLPEPQPF